MNEDLTSEKSIVFSIYPVDKEMTYLCMSIKKGYYDELGGDHDAILQATLQQIQKQASSSGKTLEEVLGSILAKGTWEDVLIDGFTPGTEGYVYVIGLNADGNKLSEMVTMPFTTKTIEKIDMDFDISYNIEEAQVTMSVIPTQNDIYYYYDCVSKAYLEKIKMNVEEYADYTMSENIAYHQKWGVSAEDAVRLTCNKGESTYVFDELNGLTSYVGFAFAVTEKEGFVYSEVASKDFDTEAVSPSNNRISMRIDEISADRIWVSTGTTNNDPYVIIAMEAAGLAGKSDDEIINTALQYDLKKNTVTGNQKSLLFTGFKEETEYYVMAFGYRNGMSTTGLVKKIITTTKFGADPKEFKFTSIVEDIQPWSAKMTLKGEPNTILYYWDATEASKTDKEIEDLVSETVQNAIDQGMVKDKLEYMIRYAGRRGTDYYNHNALTPGTTYVPFAVAIDERTGENVGGVHRGTEFSTPPVNITNPVPVVKHDKYWDRDDIIAKYPDYKVGPPNYCCLPVTVEISEDVAQTYIGLFTQSAEEPSYTDIIWIRNLLRSGKAANKIEFYLPYNATRAVAVVTIDKEGNYSAVYRKNIKLTKDGVSDIEEFVPMVSQVKGMSLDGFLYKPEAGRQLTENVSVINMAVPEEEGISIILTPAETGKSDKKYETVTMKKTIVKEIDRTLNMPVSAQL